MLNTYRVLLGVLVFQGVSGVAGGFGLVADPSGASVGLPLEWLASTPFANYLIPGVILLSLLGVVPLVVARGVWSCRPWAHAGSLFTGATLTIWIAVEIAMIGYRPSPPLQAIYGSLGFVIIGLCFTRSVRERLA